MKKRTSKFLTVLLSLIMALSLVGAAYAADETEESTDDIIVTFEVSEGVTIDIYYDKDTYEEDASADPDETNVTTAYVREKGDSAIDNSGEGQVNFRVNVEDGYELVSVTAEPEDNYKNLKGSDETGVEGIYRMTKITGDVTVIVIAQKTESEEETTATEINSETVWSYWDAGTDPAGDDGAVNYSRTSWTLADFDDSLWPTASGSFGAKYGEIAALSGGYTPANLLTQYYEDGDNIEAYFFRTTVYIEDASAVTQILGSVIYDDSATIYINGTRIAGFYDEGITENMQYGGSGAGAPNTGEISITDAETIAAALVDGENVIAVEVHNSSSSSSDIYFEFTSLTFSTDEVEEEEEETVLEQSSIALAVGNDETERGITWYYPEEGEGSLYIAKESELVDGAMPADAVVYTATGTSTNKDGYYSYQLTMTDLEPGETYAYQLVNGETVSDIYTFEISESDGSFTFAFVGDPQIGTGTVASDTEGWANTLSIIATNSIFDGIDFLLSAGDQVDAAADEEQYDGYLEHEELTGITMATVIGNHDSSSAAYSQHFNIVNASTSLGSTNAGTDYYFVYEGVLFMVLNSNNTSTAEHQEFMEEAIAATADQDITWKVVTFHHSIYSVASHSMEDSIIQRREQLVPVFEELDIDVVLMGHDHVYVRSYIMDGLEVSEDEDYEYDEDGVPVSVTDTDGILYVTANSASGSKYYNIKTDQNFEYAAVMNQDYTPNVSCVSVTATSFTITTYATDDMDVVDTFTIYKSSDSDDDATDEDNDSNDDSNDDSNNDDADSDGDDSDDGTSDDDADSDDTDGNDSFAGGGDAGTGTAPGPGSNGGMGDSSDEDEEIEIVYEQSSIVLAVGSDETERGITWYYPSTSDGTLYLAKESELAGGEMPESAAVYTASAAETNKDGYYSFQVTMSGLETGETYAYQLENDGVATEVYTFTISESDYSFTFAVAGDPQIGTGSTDTDTEGWGETLEVIATNSVFANIDFLLSVGDQVDSASSETQYNGFLEHEELLSLPLATVIGNHDTSSSAYSEHFNITNESTYGTTDAGGDYYYVYEGVLFLVLNSNNTSTSEHQAFMEEAIAATADQDITWKVVTFHHSIYSVASHAEDTDILSRRETLVPVFEELDIDVVLMGHDHVYCRTYIMDGFDVSEDEDYEYDEDGVPVSVTDTDGILYVTFNSSSGSKYYSLNGTDYEYAAVTNQERTPNISLVSVTASSFTVTTYRTEDMSEVDSFTIYKTVETEDTDIDDTDTDGTDDTDGSGSEDSEEPEDGENTEEPGDEDDADDETTEDGEDGETGDDTLTEPPVDPTNPDADDEEDTEDEETPAPLDPEEDSDEGEDGTEGDADDTITDDGTSDDSTSGGTVSGNWDAYLEYLISYAEENYDSIAAPDSDSTVEELTAAIAELTEDTYSSSILYSVLTELGGAATYEEWLAENGTADDGSADNGADDDTDSEDGDGTDTEDGGSSDTDDGTTPPEIPDGNTDTESDGTDTEGSGDTDAEDGDAEDGTDDEDADSEDGGETDDGTTPPEIPDGDADTEGDNGDADTEGDSTDIEDETEGDDTEDGTGDADTEGDDTDAGNAGTEDDTDAGNAGSDDSFGTDDNTAGSDVSSGSDDSSAAETDNTGTDNADTSDSADDTGSEDASGDSDSDDTGSDDTGSDDADSDDTDSDTSDTDSSADVGDDFNLIFWLTLTAIAALALACISVKRRFN